MKFLVETKDNLQVVGNGEEMHARYNRPSVVLDSAFMQQHIAAGTVKILARLVDEATDVELEETWLEATKDKTGDDKAAATEKVKEGFLGKYEFSEGKPKKDDKQTPAPPPKV